MRLFRFFLSLILSASAANAQRVGQPTEVDTAATTLKASTVSTAPQIFSLYPPQKKGEFESTEAFRSRVAAQHGREKFFAVDVTAQCVLFPPCIRYDADKEEISIGEPSPLSFLPGLLLRHVSKPIRTYVGTNGFGAKFRITESQETAFIVEPADGYLNSADLKHRMRADSAAGIKPRLRLLAVFAPGPDSTGRVMREELDEKEPTTSYPYEEHRTYFVLTARAISLYLWDPVSGAVIKKWNRFPSQLVKN